MSALAIGRDGTALLVLVKEAASRVAAAEGRAFLGDTDRYLNTNRFVPPKDLELWLIAL